MRGQVHHSPRAAVAGVVAPLLLLLTPFVVFLRHHEYPLVRPEVGVCVAIAAAVAVASGLIAARSRTFELFVLAALLTLFADIQFQPPKGSIGRAAIFVLVLGLLWLLRTHAARIMSLAAGAMIVSSLVVRGSASGHAQRPLTTGPARLPLLVHLVLDEHIGVAGIPGGPDGDAARETLKAFYERHGFRVFDGAYSQHFTTYRAIGHLLNGMFDRYAPELVEPSNTGGHWRLRRNEYFGRLRQRGYDLRVYQTDHLDLCAPDTRPSACQTYESTTLRSLVPLDVTVREKASVVGGMYLDRSLLYGEARLLYRAGRRHLWPLVRVPAWDWERTRLNALSSMTILDSVTDEVRQARRGQAIFAHLLIPHYPYAFDAECRPRPPSRWLERMDRDAPPGSINTEESRQRRYSAYFGQMTCLYRRLERLMAAIPPELVEDAIVVLQGDHGSRIAIREPAAQFRTLMTRRDFADAYSTLFAVHAGRIPVGHDPRVMSAPCLLGRLNGAEFSDPSVADACVTPPRAFMQGGSAEDTQAVVVPLPPFTTSNAPADPGS